MGEGKGVTPLMQFAVYLGRILLESFASWWLSNPEVTEDHGYLYAAYLRDMYREQYFRDSDILEELELNESVDPSNLVMSFLYGGNRSHFYKTRNLATETTLMSLVEEKQPLDCDTHGGLCNYIYMLQLYKNYSVASMDDFPMPRDLFDLCYELDSFGTYINPYIWYDRNYSTQYGMIFPPLDTAQAQKVVVDKDLNIHDYPYEKDYAIKTSEYGLIHTIVHEENAEMKKIVSDAEFSYHVPMTSVIDEYSGYYAFPYYYTEGGRTIIPFNINTHTGKSVAWATENEEEVNVGDHWYVISEEEERGGWAEEYSTVWIYSLLGEENIAKNLTDFAHCLANSSYIDCLTELCPWYHGCTEADDLSCRGAIENLKKLERQAKGDLGAPDGDDVDFDPDQELDINTKVVWGTMVLLGCFAVLSVMVVIAVVIAIKQREKRQEIDSLLRQTQEQGPDEVQTHRPSASSTDATKDYNSNLLTMSYGGVTITGYT